MSKKNEKSAVNDTGSASDVAEKPDALPEQDEAVEEETAQAAADEKPEQEDELNTIKAESRKNLEGWQRTLAEFQNYKRRVEREQSELRQRVTLDTLAKTLDIIDDFERAIGNVPDDLKENPWIDGVNLIQGKFNKLLNEHEVEVIDPVGEMFDPNLHQAIGKDDSDEYESGHVIETLQKGYICGDVLLRPALVRVAN